MAASQEPASAHFEALLEPVLPLSYGVAHRLAGNSDDAQDLVQEAALNAYRGFGTFKLGTNFKAWFLRILTNCFYARYGRRKREPEVVDIDNAPPLYLFTQAMSEGLQSSSQDPAAELMNRLDAEQVVKAIQSLPEEFRVVNVLYFLDDLAYQEIADILECPVGTVRSRLHRGRRMLQKALWRFAQDQGIGQGLSEKGL